MSPRAEEWLLGYRSWLDADAFHGFCAKLGLDTSGAGLEMVVMWNVVAFLVCPSDAPPFTFPSQYLQLFDSGTKKVNDFLRRLCPAIEDADEEESALYEDSATLTRLFDR